MSFYCCSQLALLTRRRLSNRRNPKLRRRNRPQVKRPTQRLQVHRPKRRLPVAAVIHRLCKLYGIPPTNTADEACEIIHAASGADISATARLFNKSVYGEIPMTEADKAKAMEDYLAAYEALRESKKKKRKLKRSPQGGN